MEDTKVPRAIRQMVILSAVFLAASLIISGVNAYVAFASPLALNTFPTTVGFEGQLLDSSGSPITGSKSLTFKLYDEASGTHVELWTETQSVTLSDTGLYSVQLGSTPDHSLSPSDFQGDRWLGITVDGNELSPRVPISSVPWSMNSAMAYGILGKSIAIATPNDGDTLVYDSASGEWKPQPGPRTTNVPSVRVYNSSDGPNINVNVPISFDSVSYDTDGIFSSPSKLVARTPGQYLIWASLAQTGTNGGTVYYNLKLNGNTIIAQSSPGNGNTHYANITIVYHLNLNEYVEVYPLGTSYNVRAAAGSSPIFGMVRVGN